jgi:hypothetical protein
MIDAKNELDRLKELAASKNIPAAPMSIDSATSVENAREFVAKQLAKLSDPDLNPKYAEGIVYRLDTLLQKL